MYSLLQTPDVFNRRHRYWLVLFLLVCLFSCSGSSDEETDQTYRVGGLVSGLVGTVQIVNSGSQPQSISTNGSYQLTQDFDSGDGYSVMVHQNPTNQTCVIENGTGNVANADITNVNIVCQNSGSTTQYSIGGTVTGMTGSMVLQNNRSETLAIQSNGTFVFSQLISDGASYSIEVLENPSGQNCGIENGIGNVAGANVTNVLVSCEEVQPFSFVVMGDFNGGGCARNDRVQRAINRVSEIPNIDFFISTGDIVDGYIEGTNQTTCFATDPVIGAGTTGCSNGVPNGNIKEMLAPIKTRTPKPGLVASYYQTIGNHDDNWGSNWYPDPCGDGICDFLDPNTPEDFIKRPIGDICSKDRDTSTHSREFYFSFPYMNSYFIVLKENNDYYTMLSACNRVPSGYANCEEYCSDPALIENGDRNNSCYNVGQFDWLRAELEAASQEYQHIFVFAHAVFLTGGDGHGAFSGARQVRALLEQYNVTMAFNGHNHAYHRSHPILGDNIDDSGTYYVTVGSSGGAFNGAYPDYYTAVSHQDWTHYGNNDAMTTWSRVDVTGSEVRLRTYTLESPSVPVDDLTVNSQPSSTSLLAFPEAKGFGANATGGRGGQVIKVTNLNASGAGSLQAALDVNAPRIIVFDVSGVIESAEPILVRYGNVTIAGQTAPGAGITLKSRFFGAYNDSVNNIIIRHIRVRPHDFDEISGVAADQYDAMQFSKNSNMIFDHVSVAFGVDETFDFYEGKDVTVQWSSIVEASTKGAGSGQHNYGLINGPEGSRVSILNNLFANNRNRNPAITNGPAEIINNVVHNVRHGFIHHNPASGNFNIIGNYYKQGPDNSLHPFYFDDDYIDAKYYLLDNYIYDPADNMNQSVDNPWSHSYFTLGKAESVRSETEFDFSSYSSYVPTQPVASSQAFANVLDRAGAFPRDIVDLRNVSETQSGTGAWGARVPSNLLEGLTPGIAPTDTDGDGMPDSWENQNGLNPNVQDHNSVMSSGYTAIEEYVNQLASNLVQ